MTKFAVARVWNTHGELDYLQRFEWDGLNHKWTTVCSFNKATALVSDYRDSAIHAAELAQRYVPTWIDGREIEYRIVEVSAA